MRIHELRGAEVALLWVCACELRLLYETPKGCAERLQCFLFILNSGLVACPCCTLVSIVHG